MRWLNGWTKAHPKLVGLFCIGLALSVAIVILYRHLNPPARTWQPYAISKIEKITIPHLSSIEHIYHLHMEADEQIGINPDFAEFFKARDLEREPKPTSIEVYSDHEDRDGIIWAEGIRLRNGELVLDPSAVKSQRAGDDSVGYGLCALLIVCGIGLQFYRPRRRAL